MDYYEARRAARSILGPAADVEERREQNGKPAPFPFRVGVWAKVERGPARFIVVSASATSWEEALKEARERQK